MTDELYDGLSPTAQEGLANAAKRWKRLASGAHLQDWLDFGPELMPVRTEAMRRGRTSEPRGTAYN